MRRDKKFMGRSTLVPYIPEECAEVRHRRRLSINLLYYESLERYLNIHNYNLTCKGGGELWLIWNCGMYYEWWPAKAKLIKNKKYRHGCHVHDVLQLVEVVLGRVITLEVLDA